MTSTTSFDPASTPADGTTEPLRNPLLTAALIGGALAISLGVYGRVHEPTGVPNLVFVQVSKMLPLKAWLATVAALLALAQLTTALMMWGKIGNPDNRPAWVKPAHRWTGTLAFVVSLPVAYHCLWAVGFQTTTTRALLHSLFGCIFYGAFASKMLLLRSKHVSSRTLPVAGGLLVSLLVAIWLTSSLWFFTTVSFPGF
jgi:Family of unknown function (DUF6529)